MVSQNCPGSRGHNFVGSVIGKILINIKRVIVYRFVGLLIRGQGLPMKITNIGSAQTMRISQ